MYAKGGRVLCLGEGWGRGVGLFGDPQPDLIMNFKSPIHVDSF